MAVEREIKTVLTLEDATFSRGMKAAAGNVAAARAEMRAAISNASGLCKGLKQWSAATTGLSKAIKGQKQQMAVLSKEYRTQKKALDDTAKALNEAKKRGGENSEEVKKAANAYAAASDKVDELRVKMAGLSMQMNQDKNALKNNLLKPIKSVGTAAAGMAKAVGAGLLSVGVALAGLAKSSIGAREQLAADVSASEATFSTWSVFIEQEAGKAWKNLGLSKDAYLQEAVAIGEYLEAAGVPVKENAELTAELLQRAADLAGAFGSSNEEAL